MSASTLGLPNHWSSTWKWCPACGFAGSPTLLRYQRIPASRSAVTRRRDGGRAGGRTRYRDPLLPDSGIGECPGPRSMGSTSRCRRPAKLTRPSQPETANWSQTRTPQPPGAARIRPASPFLFADTEDLSVGAEALLLRLGPETAARLGATQAVRARPARPVAAGWTRRVPVPGTALAWPSSWTSSLVCGSAQAWA